MKPAFRITVIVLFGILFSIGNLLAAGGDLIVKGKMGVGTEAPNGKAEICDGGACIRWEKVLGNYGNDIYESGTKIVMYPDCSPVEDTCDGDPGEFTCPKESRKKCVDVFWTDTSNSGTGVCWVYPTCPTKIFCDNFLDEMAVWKRNVTCNEEYRMEMKFMDLVIAP